uniref:RING-type domain-containing protein n=1 Tax=viral metagenome TaxID=1070528 RepID=A0A6C0E608_9ZZZZ
MDTFISQKKLNELNNLVHTDNQKLTQSRKEQLEWLYNSSKLKIDLDDLEISPLLVINRLCILYFITTKKSSQELYQSFFDLCDQSKSTDSILDDSDSETEESDNTNDVNIMDNLIGLEFWVDFNNNDKSLKKIENILNMKAVVNDVILETSDKLAAASHLGFPLPSSLTGRPRIQDTCCKFEGCKFNHKLKDELGTFTKKSAKQKKNEMMLSLVDHLKTHNCYVAGLHAAHEVAVSKFNLTTQKILDENITVCPSTICNDPTFKTPAKLILHLTALGIPSFWNSDIGSDATLRYNDYILTLDIKSVIFKIPQNFKCVSCRCTNTGNIVAINYPCFHLNVCFNCLRKNKANFNRCGECSKNIVAIYPLSSCK